MKRRRMARMRMNRGALQITSVWIRQEIGFAQFQSAFVSSYRKQAARIVKKKSSSMWYGTDLQPYRHMMKILRYGIITVATKKWRWYERAPKWPGTSIRYNWLCCKQSWIILVTFMKTRYGWFWGAISRQTAQERLHGMPNGSFLVRKSQINVHNFTISFRTAGKTLHYRIEFLDGYWWDKQGNPLCNKIQ